jgi:hypothetical protein
VLDGYDDAGLEDAGVVVPEQKGVGWLKAWLQSWKEKGVAVSAEKKTAEVTAKAGA